MSTVPAAPANDNSGWIRDLVYLAFPEGEARERVLFDLVKQFAKMDPEDPEWLRYKLSIVECQGVGERGAQSERCGGGAGPTPECDSRSCRLRGYAAQRNHRGGVRGYQATFGGCPSQSA